MRFKITVVEYHADDFGQPTVEFQRGDHEGAWSEARVFNSPTPASMSRLFTVLGYNKEWQSELTESGFWSHRVS